VGSGKVTTDTRERQTGADFLAFLRLVAREYPVGDLHVVLDNVSTHKTPDVQAWLARHPRVTQPVAATRHGGSLDGLTPRRPTLPMTTLWTTGATRHSRRLRQIVFYLDERSDT
jgi:hypothetical protein